MLTTQPAPASIAPGHLRTLTFRTAAMVMTADHTVSVFPDGRVNTMHLPSVDAPDYHAIAAWAGYGADWRRYNREHDATHHWLADRLGWRWSACLHDPEPVGIGEASQAHKDEEHIVNRLQRQVRTDEDDEYGQVQRLFGDGLPGALDDLRGLYERMA